MHLAGLYAPDIPVHVGMHSRARVGLQVTGHARLRRAARHWPDQAHMSGDLTHEEGFIDIIDDPHGKIRERIRRHG